ncbi:MAG: LapA family protein [Nitrospiria bacterium]
MIRLIILLVVLAAALLFAMQNQDQAIALRLLFGRITPPLPVYLIVLGSFALGVLVAGMLVVPDWVRTRLQLRRQRREILVLEERLSAVAVRTPAPSPSDAPRPLFPDETL